MFTVYSYFHNVPGLDRCYAVVEEEFDMQLNILIINLNNNVINSYTFPKTPFYKNCYVVDDPEIIKLVNLLLL